MSLAEPLWLSEGAWKAIRDRVIDHGGMTPEVMGLARAWDEPVRDGDRVGVFVDAEQARTLGTLLDAHPDVARLLG
ncbi:MAG TPA: hypothetical protein VFG42_08225 [Baekduia sp.]|uniref:hypothetical protein n=1 Tax=Baekduia sp. TaxID=2600305 RepID=UPI002D795845|nr:hypothetical protein [Baekduia sp.]HET6506761.1 hypothetical protein [Baekduia sp.]